MKFLATTYPGWSEKFYLTLITLMLLVCSPADVKATPPNSGFLSIQFENDLWGSNDDRFYTHGTEFSFASAETPPLWLDKVAEALPFYRKADGGIYGFSLGQKIFTPEDTKQTELIENDRPYAGWLFFDVGIADLFEDTGDRERINGLILTIGVVGPSSLAEETQKEFHRLVGADIPQGWDNQLHDELGLNVTYLRKRRRLFRLEEPRQFEISHHGGLTLGNVYTYASAGVMARWGSRLKNDIGPPSISPGFPGIPAFRINPAFNWYFFGGLEGRAIARNIFFDGNTFRDSHSVDKKYFVGDLQLGFAFHYKNTRIALSNLFRTREFDGQPERTQYGAINLTFYPTR